MKHKAAIGAGLFILSALGVWLLLGRDDSGEILPSGPAEQALATQSTPGESRGLQERDNSAAVPAQTEPPKTVREFRSLLNPASDVGQKGPAADAVSEEQLEREKLLVIEDIVLSAIAGDAEAFSELRQKARHCLWTPYSTDAELDLELQQLQRNHEIRMNNAQNRPEFHAGQDMNEALKTELEYMLDWAEDCSWLRTPAYRQFLEDLSRLASSGDVVARYAYAVLFKPWRGDPDYPNQAARWREQAAIYTEANVSERQTMGFAARASSYRSGMFTVRDQLLSSAWLYLMSNCPARGPTPAHYLEQFHSVEPDTLGINADGVQLGRQMMPRVCP